MGCRKEHRPVCCQQWDPSNVKSITAQAELFDSISHDWADTRFPGVYSGVFFVFFPRTCQEICWGVVYLGVATDWVAEYSRDKLLTRETQSRPRTKLSRLEGQRLLGDKVSRRAALPTIYIHALTKGLVSKGRSCLVSRWWKAHYVLWGTAHYLMFLLLV